MHLIEMHSIYPCTNVKKTDKAIVQIMQIDRAERGRGIYYAKYYGGWGGGGMVAGERKLKMKS